MTSKRPVDITILHANNIKRSRTAAPQAVTAVVTIDGHSERFVTNPAFGEDPVWKARHMFFIEEDLISGDEPSDIHVELYDSPQLENHIGTATINLETAMDFYNKGHTYKLLADGKPQGTITVAVSVAPRSKSPLLTPSMYSTPPLYGPPLPGEAVIVNLQQNAALRGQNGHHPPQPRNMARSYQEQPKTISSFHSRGPPPPPQPRSYRPPPYSVPHSASPSPPQPMEASGYQGYLSMAGGLSPQSASTSPQQGGSQGGAGYHSSSTNPHYSPQSGHHGGQSTSPGFTHHPGSQMSHSSANMLRTTSDSALNRQVKGRRYHHHGERDMDVGGIVEGALIGAAAGFIAADIIDDDF